jgi:hypothetical protein
MDSTIIVQLLTAEFPDAKVTGMTRMAAALAVIARSPFSKNSRKG